MVECTDRMCPAQSSQRPEIINYEYFCPEKHFTAGQEELYCIVRPTLSK